MPSSKAIAACKWLTDEDIDFHAREFERTGRFLLAEADLLMEIDGYPTIGDLRSVTLMRS
jgi:hypothetical protein